MKRPFLRLLSAMLIAGFLAQDIAWAAPEIASFAIAASSPRAREIRVSPEFASIGETYQGRGPKLLIHIQDAHANLSAQKNISKALEEILSRHKIETVFVEGGTRDDSLNFLRPLASKPARERVAKEYLMKGELSGAEYLNLSSDLPMRLIGIEDAALYGENLKAYAAVAKEREAAQAFLNEIQKRVEMLKRRLYPSHILALDSVLESFEAGERDFSAYYSAVTQAAAEADVEMAYYPEFSLLKEIKKEESSIDFAKANARDAVELEKYQAYQARYARLDVRRLLGEARSLEDHIFGVGLADDDARHLHAISRWLTNQKLLFSLQASRDDFEEYSSYQKDPSFHALAVCAFLNRQLMDTGNDADVIVYKADLQNTKKHVEDFYRLTQQRDGVFVEKVLQTMSRDKLSTAMLITGGYHTQNLRSLLETRGISYAVVSPVVTQESNLKRYERILLSQIKSEKSYLSYPAVAERPAVIEELGARLAQDPLKRILRESETDWMDREIGQREDWRSIFSDLGRRAKKKQKSKTGSLARYPTREAVILALKERDEKNWLNNPEALHRGEHPDHGLYTAAKKFGVPLSRTEHFRAPGPGTFKTKEDVELALKHRLGKGWANNPWALSGGKHKDSKLFRATQRFHVELPKLIGYFSPAKLKYPDKESAQSALDERLKKGWSINLSALKKGEHIDRPLYDAVKKFKLISPKQAAGARLAGDQDWGNPFPETPRGIVDDALRAAEQIIKTITTVRVSAEEFYTIQFTRDIFDEDNLVLKELYEERLRSYPNAKIVFLVDAGIGEFPIKQLENYIATHHLPGAVYQMPGGEDTKNAALERYVGPVSRWLYENNIGRGDLVAIIGGGAHLDTAGFISSIFKRGKGIGMIRIPTTLVSMADTATQIKTMINLPGAAKNALGHYEAPWKVVIDTDFLRTVDRRHIREGLAEMLKVAIMRDRGLFDSIEANHVKFFGARGHADVLKAIRRAAELHSEPVAQDPYENDAELRLDFGHWFAHPLEVQSEHRIHHGEAVAINMAVDAAISYGRGMISEEDLRRVLSLLYEKIGLEVYDELVTVDSVFPALERFTAHVGKFSIPLVRTIGRTERVDSITRDEIESAIEYVKRYSNGARLATTVHHLPDLVAKLAGTGDLTSEEFRSLEELTLRDAKQTNVFGVNQGNVATELTERIALFRTALPKFRDLMERLNVKDLRDEDLWTVYVPLSLWLFRRKMQLRPDEAYVVGFTGGIGIGKTTRTQILETVLNELLAPRHEKVVTLSIDDLYKTKKERQPLLASGYTFRGPPGTHDVKLGIETLKALRRSHENSETTIPQFDKAMDDRKAPRAVQGKVGVVIFEGWFLGAETRVDLSQVAPGFKRTVAEALTAYQPLFDQMDDLIVRHLRDLDAIKWMYGDQVQRQRAAREAQGMAWQGLKPEEVEPFVEFLYVDAWDFPTTSPDPTDHVSSIVIETSDTRKIISMRLGGKVTGARLTQKTGFNSEYMKDAAKRLDPDVGKARALEAALRKGLFININGITLGSTIAALKKAGILDLLAKAYDSDSNATVPMTEVLALARQTMGGANDGHLHVAMAGLEAEGFIRQDIPPVDPKDKHKYLDDMGFALTPNGRAMMAAAALYEKTSQAVPVLKRMTEYLFQSKSTAPPTEDVELQKLAKIETLIQDPPFSAFMDAALKAQIKDHVQGMLAGPIFIALRRTLVEPDLIRLDRSFDIRSLSGDHDRLRQAFRYLQALGYAEIRGDSVKFTSEGVWMLSKAGSYGVPVSYYQTYELPEEPRLGLSVLKTLLFGSKADLKKVFEWNEQFIREHKREVLVDRDPNIWGSELAHESYKKFVSTIYQLVFDRLPVPLQPKVIVGVGVGTGWAEVLGYKTAAAEGVARAPFIASNENPLVVIGTDFYDIPREAAKKKYAEAGIPYSDVTFGDIGDLPGLKRIVDEALAKLQEQHPELYPGHKLTTDDAIFDPMMLIHNRKWVYPDQMPGPDLSDDELKGLIEDPTEVFVDAEGNAISIVDYVRNLYKHFYAWMQMGGFGVATVELNAAAPRETGKPQIIGSSINTSYVMTHGNSLQYLARPERVRKIARRAGMEPMSMEGIQRNVPPDPLTTITSDWYVPAGPTAERLKALLITEPQKGARLSEQNRIFVRQIRDANDWRVLEGIVRQMTEFYNSDELGTSRGLRARIEAFAMNHAIRLLEARTSLARSTGGIEAFLGAITDVDDFQRLLPPELQSSFLPTAFGIISRDISIALLRFDYMETTRFWNLVQDIELKKDTKILLFLGNVFEDRLKAISGASAAAETNEAGLSATELLKKAKDLEGRDVVIEYTGSTGDVMKHGRLRWVDGDSWQLGFGGPPIIVVNIGNQGDLRLKDVNAAGARLATAHPSEYPTRESALLALSERAQNGWKNSPWALHGGEHKDPHLYVAAKKFKIDLPKNVSRTPPGRKKSVQKRDVKVDFDGKITYLKRHFFIGPNYVGHTVHIEPLNETDFRVSLNGYLLWKFEKTGDKYHKGIEPASAGHAIAPKTVSSSPIQAGRDYLIPGKRKIHVKTVKAGKVLAEEGGVPKQFQLKKLEDLFNAGQVTLAGARLAQSERKKIGVKEDFEQDALLMFDQLLAQASHLEDFIHIPVIEEMKASLIAVARTTVEMMKEDYRVFIAKYPTASSTGEFNEKFRRISDKVGNSFGKLDMALIPGRENLDLFSYKLPVFIRLVSEAKTELTGARLSELGKEKNRSFVWLFAASAGLLSGIYSLSKGASIGHEKRKNAARQSIAPYHTGVIMGETGKVRERFASSEEDVLAILKAQASSPADPSTFLSEDVISDLVKKGQVLAVDTFDGEKWTLRGAVHTNISREGRIRKYADILKTENNDLAGNVLYDFWIVIGDQKKWDGLSLVDVLIDGTAKIAQESGKIVMAYSRPGDTLEALTTEVRAFLVSHWSDEDYRSKLALKHFLSVWPIKEKRSTGSTEPFVNWLSSKYKVDLADESKFSSDLQQILNAVPRSKAPNPVRREKFVKLIGLLMRQFLDENRDYLPTDPALGLLHSRKGAHLHRIYFDSRPDDLQALGMNFIMSYEKVVDIHGAIKRLMKSQNYLDVQAGARLTKKTATTSEIKDPVILAAMTEAEIADAERDGLEQAIELLTSRILGVEMENAKLKDEQKDIEARFEVDKPLMKHEMHLEPRLKAIVGELRTNSENKAQWTADKARKMQELKAKQERVSATSRRLSELLRAKDVADKAAEASLDEPALQNLVQFLAKIQGPIAVRELKKALVERSAFNSGPAQIVANFLVANGKKMETLAELQELHEVNIPHSKLELIRAVLMDLKVEVSSKPVAPEPAEETAAPFEFPEAEALKFLAEMQKVRDIDGPLFRFFKRSEWDGLGEIAEAVRPGGAGPAHMTWDAHRNIAAILRTVKERAENWNKGLHSPKNLPGPARLFVNYTARHRMADDFPSEASVEQFRSNAFDADGILRQASKDVFEGKINGNGKELDFESLYRDAVLMISYVYPHMRFRAFPLSKAELLEEKLSHNEAIFDTKETSIKVIADRSTAELVRGSYDEAIRSLAEAEVDIEKLEESIDALMLSLVDDIDLTERFSARQEGLRALRAVLSSQTVAAYQKRFDAEEKALARAAAEMLRKPLHDSSQAYPALETEIKSLASRIEQFGTSRAMDTVAQTDLLERMTRLDELNRQTWAQIYERVAHHHQVSLSRAPKVVAAAEPAPVARSQGMEYVDMVSEALNQESPDFAFIKAVRREAADLSVSQRIRSKVRSWVQSQRAQSSPAAQGEELPAEPKTPEVELSEIDKLPALPPLDWQLKKIARVLEENLGEEGLAAALKADPQLATKIFQAVAPERSSLSTNSRTKYLRALEGLKRLSAKQLASVFAKLRYEVKGEAVILIEQILAVYGKRVKRNAAMDEVSALNDRYSIHVYAGPPQDFIQGLPETQLASMIASGYIFDAGDFPKDVSKFNLYVSGEVTDSRYIMIVDLMVKLKLMLRVLADNATQPRYSKEAIDRLLESGYFKVMSSIWLLHHAKDFSLDETEIKALQFQFVTTMAQTIEPKVAAPSIAEILIPGTPLAAEWALYETAFEGASPNEEGIQQALSASLDAKGFAFTEEWAEDFFSNVRFIRLLPDNALLKNLVLPKNAKTLLAENVKDENILIELMTAYRARPSRLRERPTRASIAEYRQMEDVLYAMPPEKVYQLSEETIAHVRSQFPAYTPEHLESVLEHIRLLWSFDTTLATENPFYLLEGQETATRNPKLVQSIRDNTPTGYNFNQPNAIMVQRPNPSLHKSRESIFNDVMSVFYSPGEDISGDILIIKTDDRKRMVITPDGDRFSVDSTLALPNGKTRIIATSRLLKKTREWDVESYSSGARLTEAAKETTRAALIASGQSMRDRMKLRDDVRVLLGAEQTGRINFADLIFLDALARSTALEAIVQNIIDVAPSGITSADLIADPVTKTIRVNTGARLSGEATKRFFEKIHNAYHEQNWEEILRLGKELQDFDGSADPRFDREHVAQFLMQMLQLLMRDRLDHALAAKDADGLLTVFNDVRAFHARFNEPIFTIHRTVAYLAVSGTMLSMIPKLDSRVKLMKLWVGVQKNELQGLSGALGYDKLKEAYELKMKEFQSPEDQAFLILAELMRHEVRFAFREATFSVKAWESDIEQVLAFQKRLIDLDHGVPLSLDPEFKVSDIFRKIFRRQLYERIVDDLYSVKATSDQRLHALRLLGRLGGEDAVKTLMEIATSTDRPELVKPSLEQLLTMTDLAIVNSFLDNVALDAYGQHTAAVLAQVRAGDATRVAKLHPADLKGFKLGPRASTLANSEIVDVKYAVFNGEEYITHTLTAKVLASHFFADVDGGEVFTLTVADHETGKELTLSSADPNARLLEVFVRSSGARMAIDRSRLNEEETAMRLAPILKRGTMIPVLLAVLTVFVRPGVAEAMEIQAYQPTNYSEPLAGTPVWSGKISSDPIVGGERAAVFASAEAVQQAKGEERMRYEALLSAMPATLRPKNIPAVTVTPLSVFEDLSDEEFRAQVGDMVRGAVEHSRHAFGKKDRQYLTGAERLSNARLAILQALIAPYPQVFSLGAPADGTAALYFIEVDGAERSVAHEGKLTYPIGRIGGRDLMGWAGKFYFGTYVPAYFAGSGKTRAEDIHAADITEELAEGQALVAKRADAETFSGMLSGRIQGARLAEYKMTRVSELIGSAITTLHKLARSVLNAA